MLGANLHKRRHRSPSPRFDLRQLAPEDVGAPADSPLEDAGQPSAA